jgi:hypothetical protein
VSSDEDHQSLVIYLISICAFCNSSLWLEKLQGFSVTWWWPNNRLWSFRCKAFLKSDTVAGLTRTLSLKWCLILVCLRNLIYEISDDLSISLAVGEGFSGTPVLDMLTYFRIRLYCNKMWKKGRGLQRFSQVQPAWSLRWPFCFSGEHRDQPGSTMLAELILIVKYKTTLPNVYEMCFKTSCSATVTDLIYMDTNSLGVSTECCCLSECLLLSHPLPFSSNHRRLSINHLSINHRHWQSSLHTSGPHHYTHLIPIITHTWSLHTLYLVLSSLSHQAVLFFHSLSVFFSCIITHTWSPSLHTPDHYTPFI